MSVIAAKPADLADKKATAEEPNYLNAVGTVKSWLLTQDHKRIGILYIFTISLFFLVGGLAALAVRFELTGPRGRFMQHEDYNRMFSAHGIIMIFFFLIPSIPATMGNFLIPLMIGAKDLAFPRLNLASWYVFTFGGVLALIAVLRGGVDTGWTFYTPYSSLYSNSAVSLAIIAGFLSGLSSIFTGLNFIVTIHKMRAPGLTWFRLPLFVWGHYATSIIVMLGTPVVAITLCLLLVERIFKAGIFSPELGGDPVLFQHLFWFYSHPAVYIMILPGMSVTSEIIACFCRKRVFGYSFIAFSSLAIAILGFLVWGHHMFVTSQSMYSSMVFSLITFLVAIPSAIKIFNWASTIYKGSVWLSAPMMYALGFMGLFTVGGLTGLFLSAMATDIHLTDTYFVVAHFHYVMVGGAVMAFMAALHFWFPKMTGRMYSESWGKLSAVFVFVGFNLTFFPQFIVGYLGMPRRYHFYPAEFQLYHIMSTAGATVVAAGLVLPGFYFLHALLYGQKAGPNPWRAIGLEWTIASPPPPHNFDEVPVVTWEAYEYESLTHDDGPDAHDGPVIAHGPVGEVAKG